jgi:hypothetical protein
MLKSMSDRANTTQILQDINQLIARVERLSADSAWAHRASGLRGGLLRVMDKIEAGDPPPPELDRLQQAAFELLVRAAREITPPLENSNKPFISG